MISFAYDGKLVRLYSYKTKTGRQMAQCPGCTEKRTVKSMPYHLRLCEPFNLGMRGMSHIEQERS